MNSGQINRSKNYQDAYLADYRFESIMVVYRHQMLLDRLETSNPKVVVEIGCGSELLYRKWLSRGRSDYWLIVEPAEQFSKIAQSSGLPNLQVIQSFFENAVDEVQKILPREPDLVICSSLLHEVPSSQELLASIRKLISSKSKIHVNVPNSESLHRRLGQAMGVIDNTKAMTERNQRLFQNRLYDMASLKEDLEVAGLRAIEQGGYFIKPFTHSQMECIATSVGMPVLDGLFTLGKEIPDLASEIWVEAVLDEVL